MRTEEKKKQQLFSITEASKILGMSRKTVVAIGTLRFTKNGGKLYTTRRDLVRLLGYDSDEF